MPPRQLFTSLFITAIILQSCAKAVFPTHNNQSGIAHPSGLNGVYQNLSLDTTEPNNTLWTVLSKKPGPHGFKATGIRSLSYTRLTAISSRKLLVEWYSDSALLGNKILKGSIDSGAFRIKKRGRYFGFPFIYMILSHYQLMLSKDSSNNLVVDVADGHGGMVFILSGGDTNEFTFTYKKQ